MDRSGLSKEVAGRLRAIYGPRSRRREDPMDVLIRTILSQNTSDVNSHRAFANLKARFPTLRELASADQGDIEDAIRVGGLYRRKARIIRNLARGISKGLMHLEDLSNGEARRYLKSLEGVGSKTASCVLLFALGRDVLPVDTHVYRLTRRIGLLDPKVPFDRADEELETFVPPSIMHDLHLDLIHHGRRVCRPRKPLCEDCVLSDLCEYGRARLALGRSIRS